MQLTGSSLSKVGDCTPVNERTIGCWLVSRGGRGRNGCTEWRASVEGGRRFEGRPTSTTTRGREEEAPADINFLFSAIAFRIR